MTSPLDRVKRGDLNYIKTVPVEVLLNYRSETDDTFLSEAACEDQLECCKELYRRCPEVLYLFNVNRNTILHHVSGWRGGLLRMFEYFIDIGWKAEDNDIENGKHIHFKDWCRVQNRAGGTALIEAIKARNLEIVRLWSKLDHDYELQLLRLADHNKYTALHFAVEYQDLELVKLLSTKEPSFDYAVNKIGETPLLTAMRKAQLTGNSTVDDISVNIRKLLLQTQPNQSKVLIQVGDKKWTSLHHATYNGDFGAITDILQFCPDCMELVDNEGLNFLHLAALYQKVNVLTHVLGMKDIDANFLNLKDNYGRTPLHIAAEIGNQTMVEWLLYDPRVDKMTKNAKGQKVLDAVKITFEYDKEKAKIYGVRDKMDEKELKDQSDFDLVVGALIATVSFTAGITVPGGYISDGPNRGLAVLSKNTSFEAFVISNNFALVFSLYAVFSHFCTRRLLKREDIIYQLNVATFCTLSAIFAMMVAFITGSYAVLSISNRIAITVAVNCSCFFIFALRALLRMIMQYKHSARWNVKGRNFL